MSRDALIARSFRQREVTFRVAGVARITGHAEPPVAPWDGRLVKVLIVALQRTVARRVAIHATWMCDDLGAFGEQCARPRRSVCDAGEIRRRTQLAGSLGESRAACESESASGSGNPPDPSDHAHKEFPFRPSYLLFNALARGWVHRALPAQLQCRTAPSAGIRMTERAQITAVAIGLWRECRCLR